MLSGHGINNVVGLFAIFSEVEIKTETGNVM